MNNHIFLLLTESTWRSWSKVGLLTSHLAKQNVLVDGVTFLRQTSLPYSIHFDYAFFVTVDIRSRLDKIKGYHINYHVDDVVPLTVIHYV